MPEPDVPRDLRRPAARSRGALPGSSRCRAPRHHARIDPGREQGAAVGPMRARVFVTLKNGVLDPQGKAIGHALNGLGFGAVGEVRQGKVIDLELN